MRLRSEARGILEELRRAAEGGHRAAVVFVIQRQDAELFRPFEEADPLFAATLRAVSSLVDLYAYRCWVTRQAVAIDGRVEIELTAHVH